MFRSKDMKMFVNLYYKIRYKLTGVLYHKSTNVNVTGLTGTVVSDRSKKKGKKK